jgi:hypothetical protein
MWKSYPKELTYIGYLAIITFLLIFWAGCYHVASLLGDLMQWFTGSDTPDNVVNALATAFVVFFYGIHCEILRYKEDDTQGAYAMILGVAFLILALGWEAYSLF